jgi:diaminopimelate dehydrogenase
VERIIVNDPLFLDEQTMVFPVPSIDMLEETNRGVVLERHGMPGDAGHASFLLEARFDEAGLAARMMLVAAQSLTTLHAGAHSLLDLPLGELWGQQGPVEEKEWI